MQLCIHWIVLGSLSPIPNPVLVDQSRTVHLTHHRFIHHMQLPCFPLFFFSILTSTVPSVHKVGTEKKIQGIGHFSSILNWISWHAMHFVWLVWISYYERKRCSWSMQYAHYEATAAQNPPEFTLLILRWLGTCASAELALKGSHLPAGPLPRSPE